MISAQPKTFTKVTFEVGQIETLAQRALESVAPLPDDLYIKVDVDENAATSRVAVSSMDPVTFAVDGGALEHYKQPRTLGELESLITFTRLCLEVVDRQSNTFDAPTLDETMSKARRVAWDVNLYGRVSRHGLRLHQPRYRYNFRNRHGFSDAADRAFDQLWAADDLTWAGIVELSDAALDPVVID
jgi:hypothetical protein